MKSHLKIFLPPNQTVFFPINSPSHAVGILGSCYYALGYCFKFESLQQINVLSPSQEALRAIVTQTSSSLASCSRTAEMKESYGVQISWVPQTSRWASRFAPGHAHHPPWFPVPNSLVVTLTFGREDTKSQNNKICYFLGLLHMPDSG